MALAALGHHTGIAPCRGGGHGQPGSEAPAERRRDGVSGDLLVGGLVAPAGFALYFTSYSTWLGHHGIRLEDLYVTPALRQRGVGKALLARLARVAIDEGCPRLEWDVLDWNEPAIAVYHRLGARMQNEWRIMRLSGDALHTLASIEAH